MQLPAIAWVKLIGRNDVKRLEIKSAEAWCVSLEGIEFDFNSDVGCDFTNPDDVNFELRLEVGEVGREWGEVFFVQVVTPDNRPRSKPTARFVLLPVYSFQALKAALNKILATCERNTWDECLEELRGYFRSEYG